MTATAAELEASAIALQHALDQHRSVRELVRNGEDGAATLTTAEWVVHRARERHDRALAALDFEADEP